MKMIVRPWTSADKEHLKEMVEQGDSVVRVAAAMNRSIVSVRNQARKLGTPFKSLRESRQKWADSSSNVWRQY